MAVKAGLLDSPFGVWPWEDTILANAAQDDIMGKPCRLTEINIDNAASTAVYVKLYDNRNPTVGGTHPNIVLMVPATSEASWTFREYDSNGKHVGGMSFEVGLSLGCVEEQGTGGTSSPDANVGVRLHATEL